MPLIQGGGLGADPFLKYLGLVAVKTQLESKRGNKDAQLELLHTEL